VNIVARSSRSIALALCLAILIACKPVDPTPIAQSKVEVNSITTDSTTTGQIIQTKTYDQCNANSAFNSQVTFGDNASESTQKELTLTEGGGAEASLPAVAKVKVEAAVQEQFSVIKAINNSHQESVTINVPAHTRQEYTIIWRETRHAGTIHYTVDGVPKFVNYSYRIGLEFVSASGRDIDCSVPTNTPFPTSTPAREVTPMATPVQARTIRDGCLSARTWTPLAADAGALDAVTLSADNCYSMDAFGVFVPRPGTLQLVRETRNSAMSFGMYTPINVNSTIEFNVYVDSMHITDESSIAEVLFAVAPSSAPGASKGTARFKLHVEDNGSRPVVHFMLADAGENNGALLGYQHYEYERTYAIRLELSGTHMSVYINNYRLNESPEIPAGSKVLYIGYNLPVYSGLDMEISNLLVDGSPK
jgi:hypothetical protein